MFGPYVILSRSHLFFHHMAWARETRPVNPAHSWLSIEGRARIRGIIEERIPQWRSGPRDFQVDCWAHLLEKIPVVLIAPTGGGKTAAFYGPILIYQHLLQNPVPGIPTPPPHPIALIITPLIELGNNHVSLLSVKIEITDLGEL